MFKICDPARRTKQSLFIVYFTICRKCVYNILLKCLFIILRISIPYITLECVFYRYTSIYKFDDYSINFYKYVFGIMMVCVHTITYLKLF